MARALITFIIVFILLLIIIIFSVFRSNFFSIKTVDVAVDKLSCADSNQIKNSIQLIGQNFFLFNSVKVRENIRNNFLCVRDVKTSRHFPSHVSIFVSGREPKVLLLVFGNREATQGATFEDIATPSAKAVENADSFFIDREGVIFAKADNTANIPKIYYYGLDISLGKQKKRLVDLLKILEKVKLYGLDIRQSQLSDEIFIMNPPRGPKIIFNMDQKLDAQLASLQLILNQAKIDENQLEFIDLRFDKPVVKLAPKKN